MDCGYLQPSSYPRCVAGVFLGEPLVEIPFLARDFVEVSVSQGRGQQQEEPAGIQNEGDTHANQGPGKVHRVSGEGVGPVRDDSGGFGGFNAVDCRHCPGRENDPSCQGERPRDASSMGSGEEAGGPEPLENHPCDNGCQEAFWDRDVAPSPPCPLRRRPAVAVHDYYGVSSTEYR